MVLREQKTRFEGQNIKSGVERQELDSVFYYLNTVILGKSLNLDLLTWQRRIIIITF